MEAQRDSSVKMDPQEDLEAVVSWLEEGHWEEVDQPHNAEGSTPLISACQRGLSRIMHTLLEHAADVTLCNQSNQTAMHVCPPELREELLLAMPRPLLPPQAQLMQACWQGNLQLLQHWLAHNEVDVDSPNKDGQIALMLAVRDVDLFESLESCLPWEHNPIGVVKELLTLSAHLEVCDYRGYTALQYASEIKSLVRMDIVQIIMDGIHQQALVSLNVENWVDHEECPESFFMPCCLLEQTSGISENLLQCLDCGPLSERHKTNSQDKQSSKFSLSSTDTPREMTRHVDKVERKESRQMRLLPKLPDHCRPDILNTAGALPSVEPNGVSARSWADLNTKPAPPGSSAPQSALLSRSAPTIMEPFLDASSLLQVRSNINNRLTNTKETDERGLKGSPDSKIKTPRTLAPLKRGCRNGPVLSCLRAPRPLKPIGLFPQSCDHSVGTTEAARVDREGNRLPCGSPGPLSTQGKSRDSCGKERLIDSHEQIQSLVLQCLESSVFECAASPALDVDHNVDSEYGEAAGVMFEEGVCVKSPFDEKENCEFQHADANTEIVQGGKDPQTDNADETHAKQIVSSENPSTEAYRAEYLHSKSHPSTGDTPATGDAIKIVKSHRVSVTELCPTTVDVIVTNGESVLAAKSQMARCRKERKGSIPFNNNNSFNVLACKNQNRKTVANVAFHGKTQDGKPDSVNKNMPKAIHTNTEQANTRKRVTESVKPQRGSADKKRLSNVRSQSHKQLTQKEQSRIKHPPEKETTGPPKAKSAVEYVSYNDMFQEIMQGHDGPAIFEMFATPLYDRLRVPSRSDRERQVQSAPPVKTHTQNGKNRCPKKVERKKKKQTDKSKLKRNRDAAPTGQLGNAIALEEDNTKSFSNINHAKPEVMSSVEVNDEIQSSEDVEETMKAHVLSIIQEGLSQTNSLAPILDDQLRDLGTSTEKRKASIQLTGSHQDAHEEPEVKFDSDTERSQRNPTITSSQDCPKQKNTPSKTSSYEEPTNLLLLQTYEDEEEKEPLTDELMQCLVDELISLEEKEIDTDHSENTRVSNHRNRNGPLSTQQTIHKAGGVVNMEGSYDDEAISWTKGEVLGRGAYGTVYCGLTSEGQLIAVKQVILDAMDEEMAEEYGCLQREVDLLKSLHHANIVGFLGTSLSDSIISIFMEYVPGGSIASVLHRFGPLPERVFAIYTQQILQGVAYLHSNRVIHRDLKGNNIMLMPTGVIKLIDFGCARRLSCLNQTGSNGSLLKSAHGTPYWMAPEVISETGHGRKSDIWSIGCTVFEMATGKPPLAHMDKMAALFYIGARQGLMPSLPDNFSKHAKHFVQACLISDQHQRPSTEQLLEHPFIPHRQWFD